MDKRRTGDTVADIIAKTEAEKFDIDKAEGRADCDDFLRAEIAEIIDPVLRQHVAEGIRRWRWKTYDLGQTYRTSSLIRRIEVIERTLGITPPEPVEITTFNPANEEVDL